MLKSEKITNLAAAEAVVSLDVMAGSLLQGVHGAAEQWQDHTGSLCVPCVCLCGLHQRLCFASVTKTLRKIKYRVTLSEQSGLVSPLALLCQLQPVSLWQDYSKWESPERELCTITLS